MAKQKPLRDFADDDDGAPHSLKLTLAFLNSMKEQRDLLESMLKDVKKQIQDIEKKLRKHYGSF